MGAYWHVMTITEVSLQISEQQWEEADKSPDHFLPKPYLGKFELVKANNRSGDVILDYSLPDALLQKLKPFILDAWKVIKQEANLGFYQDFIENIDDFAALFEKHIDIAADNLDDMDDALQEIEDNYYITYHQIPRLVVYHGWPSQLDHSFRNAYIGAFSLFHSYEKMGLYPEETIIMDKLKHSVRKTLAQRYEFTEFLEVMGF